MRHTASEWARWGVDVPTGDQNLVAVDIKREDTIVWLPRAAPNGRCPVTTSSSRHA